MAIPFSIPELQNRRIVTLTTNWQIVANLTPARSGVLFSNPPGGFDILYRILSSGEAAPAIVDLTLGTLSNSPDGYIPPGATIVLPCRSSAVMYVACSSGTQKVIIGELP
jgi:hypothetical protein